MPKPFVSAEIEVRSVSTMNKVFARPDQETPFRIVVMGDFSGRGSSTSSEAASSRVVSKLRLLQVDCDNLDEVMKKLNVQTQLPIPGENGLPITLRFSELDDFHPDRIFQTEIFDRARKTRKRLSDPETFAATAMEVRDRLYPDITLESGKPPREPRPAASGFPAGGFLDQVIEETRAPSSAERPLGDSPAWTAFLEQIVRPHLVQNEDPAKLELLAAVDAASGDFMRAILHQPEFQTIEAAWRAMHFLVSRVETGSQVRLYMIDISKAELAADLRGKEDLTSTRLYSLLVKESIDIPGSDPWGLLAGVYMFDQTPEDVELLHCISRIANHAGAPFISAAGCRFIGCSSLAATPDPHDWRKEADSKGMQAWEELRKQPEAQ
jgi:type VI secretion system protein ImpC